MKNHIRLPMLVGLVALCSTLSTCTKMREARTVDAAPVMDAYVMRVDSMAGESWATSPLLRAPRSLAATDDFVVVADLATDSLLILFDARTGRFIGAGANRRFPDGRLMHPHSIEVQQDSARSINMFDAFMEAVGVFRFAEPRTGIALTQFRDSLSIIQPLHLPDGRFFSTALRAEGRLALFTRQGKLIRSIASTPGLADTFPVFIRQHAYQSQAVAHPSRSHIGLLTQYADQLEIFDTSGVRLPMRERPFGFDPTYSVGVRRGAPALAMIPRSRIGYVSAAADSQHIFGLFSGKTIGSFGGNAYSARHVHVYTWTGELQRVIRLSHEGNAIAVSPDGQRLYVLSIDKAPVLRMFPLASRGTPRTKESVP